MRVLFMGTPQFAVVSLQAFLAADISICAVVTSADKPAGRGLKMQYSAVKKTAMEAGLPLLQPQKLKDPVFLDALEYLKPDLITVVAFRILPEIIFSKPPLGTINLHASLLPRYRGAAPINRAIINGESETGLTTFFIRQQVDTGNMIKQVSVPIGPNQTAGELHDDLAEKGAALLLETVRLIEKGNVATSTQDEALVSKAPKIQREDCKIDFSKPANEVHNFIRGLSPYPADYTFLDGTMLRVFDSQIHDPASQSALPGTIVNSEHKERLLLQCGCGVISIGEVQLAGKRRLPVAEFRNGYPLPAGKRLGISE